MGWGGLGLCLDGRLQVEPSRWELGGVGVVFGWGASGEVTPVGTCFFSFFSDFLLKTMFLASGWGESLYAVVFT